MHEQRAAPMQLRHNPLNCTIYLFVSLFVLAAAQWIVSEGWLKACQEAGCAVDPEPYELLGEGDFVNASPLRARLAIGGNPSSPHRILFGFTIALYGEV